MKHISNPRGYLESILKNQGINTPIPADASTEEILECIEVLAKPLSMEFTPEELRKITTAEEYFRATGHSLSDQ